ncbi:hypothetical protein EDD16DRAFT_1514568 [Pisolithus croceorrhizus]|nr:hypothetical protein EDD16DRAFT_1514568 [Pisolithus croceorrhizus]
MSSVFSVELLTTVPRAIYSYGADVVVFGMYNGEIHTLHGKDGVLLATKSTGRLMGGVAVDQTRTFFVIDNAANGFSLHRMDDAVALAEEATVVVGGRENGSVYVFDREPTSYTDLTTLKGRRYRLPSYSGATSSNEMETWISVWRKEACAQAKHETRRNEVVVRGAQVLQTVAQLVTMVMVALLVVQMMHQTQYTETSHQSLDIARIIFSNVLILVAGLRRTQIELA